MTDFDRLNRATFEHNNGISRNISPTDNIRHPIDFDRLNRETYRHNNGLSRGISATELLKNFNSCYR